MRLAGAVLASLLFALPGAAFAQQRIGVRVGQHPGFGRLVLDAKRGSPPAYTIAQDGDRLVLHFETPASIALAARQRPPRNATAMSVTDQGLVLTLRNPEVRIRHSVMGTRVVVDLLNPARRPPGDAPPAGAAAAPASVPGAPLAASTQAAAGPHHAGGPDAHPAAVHAPAQPAPASTPIPREASAPDRGQHVRPVPAPGPGVATASGPAPTAPRAAATASSAASASAAEPPASVPRIDAAVVRLVFGAPGQPRMVLLPFGADVGLAVLRRGDTLMIVADAPRALNLAALRGDPVFGGMQARVVPGGTVLSLRLAEPAAVDARRRDGAWSLVAVAAAPVPATPPVLEAMTDAPGPRLMLRTPHAGRVLAVQDPETGLPLLIGTVRMPGMAMTQLRRLPEMDLLPSLVGLATLARSDAFALRATTDGFVITAAGGTLALDPAVAAPEQPRAMTRLFDIPTLPAATLAERLRTERAAVGAAPPMGRSALRRAAAETLLALGMPQEAQGVLALAAAENPAAGEDPVIAGLAGAAALLAGRVDEAEALERSDLPERDETLLWRALREAARGDAATAAPKLAATLPLVLAYPETLRARLLAPVAAALVEARHAIGLRTLVSAGGDRPELAFARAALAEAEGRRDEALRLYDAVAQERDRQARALALRRRVELRLADGKMTDAEAADALDASLYAWRGDLQEISTRRRIAELRTASGNPHAAMTILQETATLFPAQAAALRPALQDAFLASLDREAPLAAVALHDAQPDLLPADSRGDAALLHLADRLTALDLPDRAASLLAPAMQRAAPGSTRRAELGLRLAGLRLEEGGSEAPLAALRDSDADALPAALARERALLGARAEARAGRRDAAIATLQGLGPEGAEPLAELLAEAQDWAGAARAQAMHLQAALPAGGGPLEEGQARAVLRQAALLGLAGDAAGLAALAASFGPRLPAGPLADAFGALTAGPLQGLADLPRLQRELRLFRTLPSPPGPLRAASLQTR